MPLKINWPDLLHPPYTTVREMIEGHHWNENMTQDMIADHLGIATMTLKKKAKELRVRWKCPYWADYARPYSRNPKLR